MKLIGFILGQDAEKTIELSIKSLEGCDKIIYLDGGSTDKTLDIVSKYSQVKVLKNKWDSKQAFMAATQKTFGLDYMKKHYLNEWCIYLDADEMLDDNGIEKLRKYIDKAEMTNVSIHSVKMSHLIYNLSLEDNTVEIHFAPTRLFKITNDIYYPEQEHCILNGNTEVVGACKDTTIWHLAYCGGIWDIKKRYKGQKARRNKGSHQMEFLNRWKNAHLFGQYPVRQVNPTDLPELLLNEFDIEKDELYFANRGLETKHFIMSKQWLDFFKSDEVMEFGCGKAPFGYAITSYGYNYIGVEISEYAVKNAFVPIQKGDITSNDYSNICSLVLAIDVLEHVDYNDLNKAIDALINASTKYILISVPVIGDPNLEADSTHKIKETKEWWKLKFESKGLKSIEVPQHFLFRNQLMIFEK